MESGRKTEPGTDLSPLDDDRDPYLSGPQAARELGVAIPTVFAMAARGELVGQPAAGRTLITKKSVREYKARRAAQGEAAAAAR